MTTKTQRRERDAARLDELKHQDWPRFSLDHIGGEVDPGIAARALLIAAETPANVPLLNAYLKRYVPGECPSCGYGRFSWGLFHGAGSCACGWPGVVYHFIGLCDGSRLRIETLLWAHPYEVHVTRKRGA